MRPWHEANSVTQAIKTKLVRELNANIQSDWLSECVNFFVERDSTCDFDELYELSKEQFLLNSITDTSNRVISEVFFSKKKDFEWTMNDIMLLQMQFILDISEPPYEQWRRLHNKKLDDIDADTRESKTFHTKKKRMFKLELTDGYRTVHAMESKPIKCLHSKLKPGVKVIISGPVKVVNAIFFLKPENIKIAGGEVDDLLIVNAYENILLKQLKKLAVDNPVSDYAEAVYEEETVPPQNNFPTVQRQQQPKTTNAPASTSAAPVQQPYSFDDDDDDIEIDLDLIDRLEAEARAAFEAESRAKAANEAISNEPQHQSPPPPPPPPAPLNVSRAHEFLIPNLPDPEELSEDMEVEFAAAAAAADAASKPIEVPVPKISFTDDLYPHKIEGRYNFVTIDQYVSLNKAEKMKRTYAIEAKVEGEAKVRVVDNAWLLFANLRDVYSKSLLSVRLSNELIAKMAGRTAQEMTAMQIRSKTQPQLKIDMHEALQNINEALNEKLLLLTVTMKLKLPASFENLVENTIEKTDDAKQLIILKLHDEDIQLA